MQLPRTTEYCGIRVLTTEQLANSYETTSKILQYNFSYNRKRYTEGKHYIALQGEELRAFKADLEIQGNLKYAHILYLWTEKGALLHAKSLNTDKAWEVYEYLVDFYFRVKEKETEPKPIVTPSKPPVRLVVDIPENQEAQKAILEIKKAIGAIEIMVDESNRYINAETYERYQSSIGDTLQALISRINRYLFITPKKIEKYY